MRSENFTFSALSCVGAFALATVIGLQGYLAAVGLAAPIAAAVGVATTLALLVVGRPNFQVLKRGRTLLDVLLSVLLVVSATVLIHRYSVDARRLAWTFESGPQRGEIAQATDVPAWGQSRSAIPMHAAPNLDRSNDWANVVSALAPSGGGSSRLSGMPQAFWRVRLQVAQPNWAVLDPNAPGGVTSGDGVHVRVVGRAADGVETSLTRIDIKPQQQQRDRCWHALEADVPAGAREIVVQVLPGDLGSHNHCDHVLVSVESLEARVAGLSLDGLIALADGVVFALLALLAVVVCATRAGTTSVGERAAESPASAEGGRGRREEGATGRYVLIALLASPAVYLAVLVLPSPLGMGLYFANDFTGHRIWYTQVDAYFVSKGYFALWNPTFEFGNASLAGAFGTGALYPLRWWTYAPTIFGGLLNFYTQYVQVALHMAIGLGGLYLLLRRHARVSPSAAALGALVFLLNQCFNNFIRFPHGIENACWVPWMLHFALSLTRRPASEPYKNGLEAHTTHGLEAHTTHGLEAHTTRDFFALSLCVALGWLAGYGQFSYMGALLVGLMALCHAQSLVGFLRVAGAGLLGSAVSIGAILPAVEWAVHHPLRGGKDISGIATIGDTDYAEMLLNPFGVDVHYNFFTLPIFAWVAAVGLVVAWRRSETRRVSLAMLVALALLIEVTRGDQGYLFAIFYRHLPMFSAFNSPAKYAWLLFIPMAWFVAMGVETLDNRRAAWPAVIAIALAAGACAYLAAPRVAQPIVGMHQPLAMQWLSEADAAVRFQILLWVSAAAGALFLLIRRPAVHAALIVILAATFSIAFAARSTFLSDEPDPAALIATRDAFPDGLLARRLPAEYLRLRGVGVTSPNVDPDIWHLIMSGDARVLGPSDARFPRTRFLWEPHEPRDPADITLTSFGPNHCFFEVRAAGPGDLTWLTRYSPHWRFSVVGGDGQFTSLTPARLAPYEQFFRLPIGETAATSASTVLRAGEAVSVRAEFVPVFHIVGAAVTILGVFALLALTAATARRRWLAISVSVAGLLIALAAVTGSLARHGMENRDLVGRLGEPAGRLEASRTLGRRLNNPQRGPRVDAMPQRRDWLGVR